MYIGKGFTGLVGQEHKPGRIWFINFFAGKFMSIKVKLLLLSRGFSVIVSSRKFLFRKIFSFDDQVKFPDVCQGQWFKVITG